MFRMLMMSGRGPDGYPLDVHGPTLPLQPQDPVWTQRPGGSIAERAALLQHAQMLRDRRTADRQLPGQFVHGHRPSSKLLKNRHARGIAQGIQSEL